MMLGKRRCTKETDCSLMESSLEKVLDESVFKGTCEYLSLPGAPLTI
eukprot:CAMPEP_0185570748 /NCGR_PEP_ID=MMETSP0434-20130131/2946_1 /TAXON_ID=626734 ORGANISM="Favella taraikaensis, Strain Fe Narragansett Bay" /NCGR_SAMPLE_ID=MMETSP0434 /ASSEMBLY_ACC=CAM_ASM_000379 /LENGTH=46 /DNA_ID= /DNA_START= /DNA_END= /DNA_ORIENTATION=